jgi:putative two-component system response regulator
MVTAARLRKAGYNVLEADNGKDGIGVVRSKKPDLFLLDLALPEIDGYGVCRLLRGNEETRNILIILFTASVTNQSMDEKTKELGANDFIVKPFDHKELLKKVNNILGK